MKHLFRDGDKNLPMSIQERPGSISDLKIKDVEAIYVRLGEVCTFRDLIHSGSHTSIISPSGSAIIMNWPSDGRTTRT